MAGWEISPEGTVRTCSRPRPPLARACPAAPWPSSPSPPLEELARAAPSRSSSAPASRRGRPRRLWRTSPVPPLEDLSRAAPSWLARSVPWPSSPSQPLEELARDARRRARLAPGRGHPRRPLWSLPSPPLVVGGNMVGNGELSGRGRDWEWERVVVFTLANSRKN
jgi:hypothetical protein